MKRLVKKGQKLQRYTVKKASPVKAITSKANRQQHGALCILWSASEVKYYNVRPHFSVNNDQSKLHGTMKDTVHKQLCNGLVNWKH